MKEQSININVPGSQVARLIRKFEEEFCNESTFSGTIDKLQLLVSNRENSEYNGLAGKLSAVGRIDEIKSAELDLFFFEKMMEKYTHYESAQQLFFFFMSRILRVFNSHIMPKDINLSRAQVEEIISEKIIVPIMAEMDSAGGSQYLTITESDVTGIVYWLAERCHINW